MMDLAVHRLQPQPSFLKTLTAQTAPAFQMSLLKGRENIQDTMSSNDSEEQFLHADLIKKIK